MRREKHAKDKKSSKKHQGKRVQKTNYNSKIIDTLKKRRKVNRIKTIIYIFLLLIVIGSIIYLGMQFVNNYKTQKDNKELKNNVTQNINNESQETENNLDNRIEKVKELQKENSDIIGWIEIDGTNINYPVLQGQDNSYYMNHNYKKEKSKDGSLFLDKDYNWDKPSSNLLIYGHNNRGSKEMFVDLLKYKEEDFYKEHKIIRFTTDAEDSEYEIISAFLSRVYYKHETDVFRYYYFVDAENQKEYDKFVEESKKASLYDIEATAEYGDQLLTLSTCEYSQEDGRFAVVARKKQ